jgi:hypothetical protein
MRDIDRRLAVYGSDVTRWPDSANKAREAALTDPAFRRRFEEERSLDRRLATERNALDQEIARSGALARLRGLPGRRNTADALAGISWRRVAAGVLFAGMLGGALDLMLPSPPADPVEIALVDPLAGFDAR